MPQKAIPFDLFENQIWLLYYPDYREWGIAQKKGQRWSFFRPTEKNIWDGEFGLTDKDPQHLMQLFVVALGAVERKYELAMYIRNRWEAVEKMLELWLMNKEVQVEDADVPGNDVGEPPPEEREGEQL
ncbi:MAG: hypothetical protein NZM25_10140 [Leptospiraceae bacterium]|nr:hypothetical protein [Leptospiraceae bacterium]MDW8307509.1 hypothetical protein [Leptospiraceae bacterium]